ncbi:MAG TPA: bestrophin family protein [Haliangiales bacterium]|nr:bestrophin family protein [Haliangiales bacterium]
MVDYDAKSWFGLMFQMRGAVLPRVLGRMVLVAAIGVVAALLFERNGMYVPPVGHTLVGVALGLLLVFRTNTAYERFWDGRRLFGTLVNHMRDFARQATSYLPDADDRRLLVRYIQLTYVLIRQHVRRERDLAVVGGLATDEERAALEPAACRPMLPMRWISDRLAQRANAQALHEGRVRMLDIHLSVIAECLGGAERILTTPIPFAYAQHIKSFLALFCLTAPFAIVQVMGWYTPLASAIVAFALFGIDEIGVEIEEPFGYDPNDLPLDRFGETISRDIRQIAEAPAMGAP